MKTSRYFLAISTVLAAAAFGAEPAKPRVMVIVDTSRSMLEPTNASSPLTPMAAAHPDGGLAGGDWDPARPDQPCNNKFCTAKKVISNVIPQFTPDARIGLTTYYQFLLKADTVDNRQTKCVYDILAPAGQLRTFTSPIDLTGSGSVTCPGGPGDTGCDATTRRSNFPDGVGSAQGLDGICADPVGYSRPTLPNATPPNCTGPAGCYTLTKTVANTLTSTQCIVFSRPDLSPISTLPQNLTSACTPGRYTNVSATKVYTNSTNYARRTVTPAGTPTCGGTAWTEGTSPTGGLTSTPSLFTFTSSTQSGWSGLPTCSTEAPCTLYLQSNTPDTTSTSRSWYGFFDDANVPPTPANSLPATSPPSYPFSQGSQGAGYVSTVLTGSRTLTAANPTLAAPPCELGGLKNSNETLSGFYGISSAQTTLNNHLTVKKAAAQTDETPTLTGSGSTSNYTCTAGWPCSVTLVSDVLQPTTWSTASGPLFNPSGIPTSGSETATDTQRLNGVNSTPTYTLRIVNPALTSCPPIGTTTSANPNPEPLRASWTATAPSCGTGINQCTFSDPIQGSASTLTCAASVSKFTVGAPANCAFNGKAYTGPTISATDNGGNAYFARQTVPSTTSCTTGTFTAAAATPYSSHNLTFPAALTYVDRTPTTDETSGFGFNKASPVTGYGPSSGGSLLPLTEEDVPSGLVQTATPAAGSAVNNDACLGKVDGDEIQSSTLPSAVATALCGAGGTPCTLIVKGVVAAANNCGESEGDKPCNVCRYQRRRFRWSRPNFNCNYSASRYDYAVDQSAITCSYTRTEYGYQNRNPAQRVCNYSVGARRYDFTQPFVSTCKYFAVQSTLESPQFVFTYQYLTKGTEPIGRGIMSSLGNQCTNTWVGDPSPNAFGTACPETANCASVTSVTSVLPTIPSGSTCRLRWGGPDSLISSGGGTPAAVLGANAVVPLRNDGRFSRYKSLAVPFTAVDANHRACEPGAATPVNAETYKSEIATPRGFCANTGVGALTVRKLISDYYDPATTNNLGFYNTAYPTASGWTRSWTNSTNKTQGFGGAAGTPTSGSGALSPRSLFVPIPNDSTYDAAQQRLAIEKAMGKCVRGSAGEVATNSDDSLVGGACVADERILLAAAGTTTGDFTPLYGSLKSTYDYMKDRWDLDENDQQCRDYFIVLATDGLENTPKGYTVAGSSAATSVQGLVSSFRNTTETVKTRPDVKTFIIGVGSGAAGEPALDAVAAAGGTGAAFTALNLTELETALSSVFTTITQGVFSRSRPALGSDGRRLYAAQFIRPSVGPDWTGLLSAYAVNANDGTYSIKWEHGAKLNDSAHPARSIKVGLKEKAFPYTKVVVDFSSGGELNDQLNDWFEFPSTLTTAEVISFLRNKGDDYLAAAPAPVRSSKLGPIVQSAPVVVSKTPYDRDYGGTTNPEKDAFEGYKTNTASRGTNVLFTANDGMLHAVKENDTSSDCTSSGESSSSCPNGTENWAFIPGDFLGGYVSGPGSPTLVESLYKLKQGLWNTALLDNTLSVADVCGSGANGLVPGTGCLTADWKTIAIMSQRAGGRSVGAVDVTNLTVPDAAHYLWKYTDDDLGFTYSVPAVGRARSGTQEQFVTIFGGGVDDDGTTGATDIEGNGVYVLNALTGNELSHFTKYTEGGTEYDILDQVVARPAVHRRPGANFAFINSAYVGAGQGLFAMRLAKADGSLQDDKSKWKPDLLFNPNPSSTDNARAATCSTSPCDVVKIRKVVETAAGNPTATPPVPPTYALQDDVDLFPGTTKPPIWNRPRLAPILTESNVETDLFVGTGDVRDPGSPGLAFKDGNYFYALHDFNKQLGGATLDGKALWVVKFPKKTSPDRYEQVVSEPALITGCIVVATYTTPIVGNSCNQEGDTILYGFNPRTGALQNCLTYLAPSPYAGQSTSVIKMAGVGIPSDLVVINDNVYLATSKKGLERAPVRVPPRPGAVRSYRRIK